MPPTGAERWFHTLVVVGAALAGCGGKMGEQGSPSTSTSGGTPNNGGATSAGAGQATGGGSSLGPDACSFPTEFVCDDYSTRSNCRCDPSAPHDRSACQSPFDFVCSSLVCQSAPGELCIGSTVVGCRCDPSAPRPADCEAPEQFFCRETSPLWRDCACRPESPVYPASCETDDYCCQSWDPRFGCDCCPTRIK